MILEIIVANHFIILYDTSLQTTLSYCTTSKMTRFLTGHFQTLTETFISIWEAKTDLLALALVHGRLGFRFLQKTNLTRKVVKHKVLLLLLHDPGG